ncbi:hypothetical protein BCR34DRAFT_69351 [Clohesyomyces aquaticus]|uniref:Uncharacterized protein n=1 Tax=Clohesyomyces aquaticus TaxID=1231657 RepID=A0A1Y1Z058_9PLEO|nr:hypothetical protein BCR34DRAFT_69351 [Clohesyomyces aquaticus]
MLALPQTQNRNRLNLARSAHRESERCQISCEYRCKSRRSCGVTGCCNGGAQMQ